MPEIGTPADGNLARLTRVATYGLSAALAVSIAQPVAPTFAGHRGVIAETLELPGRPAQQAAAWPQFGGPARDFSVPDPGLADTWPSTGPPVVWDRELGPGYAAITSDGARLFTLVGGNESETVVAIDAATGEPIWSTSYGAPSAGMNYEYGPGPHAAPLLANGRLFTIGSTGKLYAFDPASGEVLWSRALIEEMGGTRRDRGYSSSPLAWRDSLILFVGGPGQALVSLRQSDGALQWSSGDFANGHSSPMLIDIDGRPMVVAFLAGDVAGFDPDSGDLYWSQEHTTSYGLNISMPVWNGRDTLLVSSGYGTGSRGVRLVTAGGGIAASEVWTNHRVRAHFGTVVRLGEMAITSSGDFGPAFLTALLIDSGEELWRDRSFAKASFVLAGDKLVLLDEDGTLALVRVDETGPQILAQSQVFSSRSWTAPTLVGSMVFLRNGERITARDLGSD